jgi:hypothetical protein
MLAELHLVLALAIGIVYSISALAKMLSPNEFAHAITQYKILPSSLSRSASIVVMLLEFCLAFSHLTGLLLAVGATMGIAMLIGFMVATTIKLKRGERIPCYCFGPGGEPISYRTLVRTTLLIFSEGFLLFTRTFPRTWDVLSLNQFELSLFSSILLLVITSWILIAPDIWYILRPGARSKEERVRTFGEWFSARD